MIDLDVVVITGDALLGIVGEVADGAGQVRERVESEDLCRHRIPDAGWDGIVGQRLLGDRIVHPRGEDPLPLRGGGHSADLRGGVDLARTLPASEEEGSVPYDRAAECSAELVLDKEGLGPGLLE